LDFDVQGQIWEEIQVPLRVLGGKLSKVVTMADKVFFRDGGSLRECGVPRTAAVPGGHLDTASMSVTLNIEVVRKKLFGDDE
jgi:hypothetical protein